MQWKGEQNELTAVAEFDRIDAEAMAANTRAEAEAAPMPAVTPAEPASQYKPGSMDWEEEQAALTTSLG